MSYAYSGRGARKTRVLGLTTLRVYVTEAPLAILFGIDSSDALLDGIETPLTAIQATVSPVL